MEIKPIESHAVRNGFVCDTVLVRILEKQFREVIELLVTNCKSMESLLEFVYPEHDLYKKYNEHKLLIEKAYGEPWEKIRDKS